MTQTIRIARPVTDLERAVAMYTTGLGLSVISQFVDHDGFDGTMLEPAGLGFHFEFTHCRQHPVKPMPTEEDVIVFFEPSAGDWEARCDAMLGAGFEEVESFNPYWSQRGRTFQDFDGYRVVIEQSFWRPA